MKWLIVKDLPSSRLHRQDVCFVPPVTGIWLEHGPGMGGN